MTYIVGPEHGPDPSNNQTYPDLPVVVPSGDSGRRNQAGPSSSGQPPEWPYEAERRRQRAAEARRSGLNTLRALGLLGLLAVGVAGGVAGARALEGRSSTPSTVLVPHVGATPSATPSPTHGTSNAKPKPTATTANKPTPAPTKPPTPAPTPTQPPAPGNVAYVASGGYELKYDTLANTEQYDDPGQQVSLVCATNRAGKKYVELSDGNLFDPNALNAKPNDQGYAPLDISQYPTCAS